MVISRKLAPGRTGQPSCGRPAENVSHIVGDVAKRLEGLAAVLGAGGDGGVVGQLPGDVERAVRSDRQWPERMIEACVTLLSAAGRPIRSTLPGLPPCPSNGRSVAACRRPRRRRACRDGCRRFRRPQSSPLSSPLSLCSTAMECPVDAAIDRAVGDHGDGRKNGRVGDRLAPQIGRAVGGERDVWDQPAR